MAASDSAPGSKLIAVPDRRIIRRHKGLQFTAAGTSVMVIADYYVRRVAKTHRERHGADAVGKARERVRELVRRGDSIGADMWIRIVIVLNELAARENALPSLAD